ncbi:Predicted membrane protein, putative toxin regulator [Moraxella ovis]|uniref:Predicted membrane protein, putative toxin regulator n=1 Tax=Moraxella ovis TaxID=29433 RepID=A0A378PIG0_9GAMM|nr:PTS sugar transporter subunit IIC [Moraxella ovis]STY86198.1 Predicted membrane protein, putative toxin regulator [Moraxella ovis]
MIGAKLGKFVHKTTPVDIIITPAITLCAGMGAVYAIAPAIASLMTSLGQFIGWARNYPLS